MEDDGALAQKLLDRGVSAFEGSWFIVAIRFQAKHVVWVLLDAGADPNEQFGVVGGDGVERPSTPLDQALFSAAPSVVALLLSAGNCLGWGRVNPNPNSSPDPSP